MPISKVLQLAVKAEYFDAMKRGEKTEEYRLVNAYWGNRIFGRNYDTLIITKGYPRKDDEERRIVIPYDGYEIKMITHPHFGDDPVKVFAIKVNYNKSPVHHERVEEPQNATANF